jgi:uncharacterized protein (TIGR02186 family)
MMKTIIQISIFLLLLLPSHPVNSAQLVSDLSTHEIELRYSFTGRDLMLFGAIDHIGPADQAGNYDIVVVIKGPNSPIVVRRKDKIAGIWVNNASVIYKDIPSFYAFASNKPLEEITTGEILETLHLGIAHIEFEEFETEEGGPEGEGLIGFKEGLIRNKVSLNLYQEVSDRLFIMNNTLFRSEFYIPSNVPVGQYDARVYLFKDGEFITSQETGIFKVCLYFGK